MRPPWSIAIPIPVLPFWQAGFGSPSTDRDAVGDAPRQPVPPPENLAPGCGQRVPGNPLIPGVSNRHRGVCGDQNPGLQCEVRDAQHTDAEQV